MEKYKEIWIREKSFLEKVIKESALDKEELYSRIEKLTKGRNSELDSVKSLDSESAKDLREDLSAINESIFVKEERYNTYNDFVNSPYFFRIGTDRGAIYISKHLPNLKNNIVSFTSPVAQLRYGELNKPIKIVESDFSILEKDEIEIENSKLLKLIHKDLDSNYTYGGEDIGLSFPKPLEIDIEVKKDNLFIEKTDISREEEKRKIEKPVFKPIEGEKVEEKRYVLGEIIEQMREEQDEIMRAPITGVTLISGTAGSGKTNIAFHRIVYLIREHGIQKTESLFSRLFKNSRNDTDPIFHEDNIAVFCFNVPLKKYLSNLSKELGISKVNVYSIDKWIWDKIKDYSDFNNSISYSEESEDTISKTRKEQVYKIDAFVKNKMDDLLRDFKISKKEGLNGTLGELLELSDSIENISSLFERSENIQERYKQDPKIIDSDYEKQRKKTIKDYIKEETFNIVKRHFLTEKSKLKKFKFQFRCYDLLSEYYDFINDKDSYQRIKENNNIYISDATILCHILVNLTEGDTLKFFSKYDHVVIDEVQDFLPLQTILLKKICKNSMTIVGDTTQGIFSQGIKSWEEVGIPIDYHYELKLSHRSTLENILFANEIVSTKNKSLATMVAKRGTKPVISISTDFDEVKDRLLKEVKEIKKISPKDSIVVVYPENYKVLENLSLLLTENNIDSYIARKDTWEFGTRVSITFYHQIKGLEFDHVIILGLNTFETSDKIKNKDNLLYTVITRAQKRTYILCENELPDIIKKVDKDLYHLE